MAVALSGTIAGGAEWHVAVGGDDANPGTASAPLRTIQRAADLAQPGDTVTVHAGVYRERVNPPRGGESDDQRIVYQAAPGAVVELKGSEVVTGWTPVTGDVWRVVLPNTFFGAFNPFADVIQGNWFRDKGRTHHTGAVYLNGHWLVEAAALDEVLGAAPSEAATHGPLWFAQVDATNTTVWAQFKGVNPNEALVEVNVRQTVFYPDQPGRNFITVRGFTMRHAATPWAPPSAEQVGLIGPHWSKGWIIEHNTISHSVCAGISLGKFGDELNNKSGSAKSFVATIERALERGWNRETIGHHVVRHNRVSHCEQAGIVGAFGCAFSVVESNTVHDIHVRRLFDGDEQAGIKFHGPIDTVLRGNHVYRTPRGMWLDWMTQGTRVTQNLFHENFIDFFSEVNHGPYLVDNNVFLSRFAIDIASQGGAYVHNLIAGRIKVVAYQDRVTPYHKPHSTEIAGMRDNPAGDDRYFNNILHGSIASLAAYDQATPASRMGGNIFLAGAKPSALERDPLVVQSNAQIRLQKRKDGHYLNVAFDPAWMAARQRPLVTTALLGVAALPDLPFVQANGTDLRVDTDFFGRPRDPANPAPGPFERPGAGELRLR